MTAFVSASASLNAHAAAYTQDVELQGSASLNARATAYT